MLSTAIVAVGIDDLTAQHLTSTGHVVENPGPSAETLFGRMVAAPAEALILGNQTGLDGRFVERIRAHHIDTPAIRIADGPRDKYWSRACADFLDCGGDDVIVGPPHPEEVEASIRAICRRSQPDDIALFWEESSGTLLEVNITKRRITIDGHRFLASHSETIVLLTLASAPCAVSREALCQGIQDWHEFKEDCIDVFICRLRKQMGDAALLLETVRGVGYQLVGRMH